MLFQTAASRELLDLSQVLILVATTSISLWLVRRARQATFGNSSIDLHGV